VPTGTATFDLTINAVQGFDLTVTDLPGGPFAPDQEITFTLNYDRAMNPGESWQGLLTIGPGMAPGVVKVPVTSQPGRSTAAGRQVQPGRPRVRGFPL